MLSTPVTPAMWQTKASVLDQMVTLFWDAGCEFGSVRGWIAWIYCGEHLGIPEALRMEMSMHAFLLSKSGFSTRNQRLCLGLTSLISKGL